MMKSTILLALALVLPACASAEPIPTPAPDSPVSTQVPPDGLDGLISSPAAPSPSPVEPQPDLIDVHPLRWQGASVGHDDRTLTLTFWTGVPACYGLDRVDVAYGAKYVTATLYEGTVPGAGACVEMAVFASTTVSLDQDIAGRKILDGSIVKD